MNTDAATNFQLGHTPGVGVIMYCTRRHAGAQYIPPARIRTALDVIAYAEAHEREHHTPLGEPLVPLVNGTYLTMRRGTPGADEYLASWARHPANDATHVHPRVQVGEQLGAPIERAPRAHEAVRPSCQECHHPVGAHGPAGGCSIVSCNCAHPTGIK